MAQTLIKLVAKVSLFSLSHAALQQSASELPIVNALSLKLASRGFALSRWYSSSWYSSSWYSSSYLESLNQATRVGGQESAAVGKAEALPRAQDHHNMNLNKGQHENAVADIAEELEIAADATPKEVTAADSAAATLQISTYSAIQLFEEMRMKLKNGQHKNAVAEITRELERAVDAAPAEQQIGVRFAADAAAAAEKQKLVLRAYSQAYKQMKVLIQV